ncbi:hypothetical protein Tco_0509582 [Tanacetum coccineum]
MMNSGGCGWGGVRKGDVGGVDGEVMDEDGDGVRMMMVEVACSGDGGVDGVVDLCWGWHGMAWRRLGVPAAGGRKVAGSGAGNGGRGGG